MTERKQIIVLNGIHGAGKSIHGIMLSERNGGKFQYFPEIGGILRKQVDYNVLQSGVIFDRMVHEQELLRDKEVIACRSIPIVETWHIGNLAYIAERSPSLVEAAKQTLKEQLQVIEPISLLFEITSETFKQRVTERINPDQIGALVIFYQAILNNIYRIYEEFSIAYEIIQNNGSIESSYTDTTSAIGRQLHNTTQLR